MAAEQSHFSLSIGLAALYGLAGFYLAGISREVVLLSSVIVIIAGILPNLDEPHSIPRKEIAAFFAAILPILALEFVPELSQGGLPRMALVVIACYLVSRLIVATIVSQFTAHRGMIHSLPAAIISAEIVYLIFRDLSRFDRVYLSFAALMGFLVHLVMDAYTNLDLVNRVRGKDVENKPSALKMTSGNWANTCAWYATMLVLGWFIVKDFYPGLKLFTNVEQ